MKRKIIAILGAVIAVAAVSCVLLWIFHTPTVVFYGLDESSAKALALAIDQSNGEKKIKYETVLAPSDKALKELMAQGLRPDLVFLYRGANAETLKGLAERNGLPKEVLAAMTSSVRASAMLAADGTVTGVPLLLDHYELAIDRTILEKTGTKIIATWADIEAFASKAAHGGVIAPLVFAGKDDRQFVDIVGALAEAFSGADAWHKAVEAIQKAQSPDEYARIIQGLTADASSPLYGAVRKMATWYNQKLMYRQSFSLDTAAMLKLMDEGVSAIVCMPLSLHRTVSQDTINRFASVYMPGEQGAAGRYLTAPEVMAVPLAQSSFVKETITALAGDALQAVLSRSSGLAPALANSAVADRQSDDVRYWVAATNAPLPGLSQAALVDDAQRAAFAKALREAVLAEADAMEREQRGY